jgi:NADH:ubiquinone oxidoreductase subunit F (NADH-binding)/NADH:ubiquinone oxidoreductase subunit E
VIRIASFNLEKVMIVQELTAIQKRCGYLPEAELIALARRLTVPLHRLHEVASFFPLFRLQPGPAVEVKVCRDMACHLSDSKRLRAKLAAIGQEIGTGSDVEVEGVSCLGQCDHAPAVSINDHVYWDKTEAEYRQFLQMAAGKQRLTRQKADRSRPRWKIDRYDGDPRYEAVKQYIKQPDPDGILAALKVADLRGMGGAGFRTHLKWSTVRSTPGDVKYVVCNADESEPGTFKDRELLRRTPYLVIEGMILAGLVTGATKGFIYIRHEYEEEASAVEEAISRAFAEKICGANILGSNRSFTLELYTSPGGYIQGEETALLEAMEDRRGEPRNKPPFPVTNGLYGKPTVINNVETLAWVPAIVLRGGEWYRDQGTNGATGLRLVSISGDVNAPGVYEVPFGQTVGDLILNTAGGMRGGQKLKAIAPSGPSGGFLPARIRRENLPEKFVKERLASDAKTYDIFELPLDLNTVSGMGGMLGAAFVVYGEQANIVENALNCVEFYRNESCGKCVPCRMGSQKLVELIGDILGRRFPRQNLGLINELADTMTAASICGLGQVAANPIASVIKHFPEDLDKYLGRR